LILCHFGWSTLWLSQTNLVLIANNVPRAGDRNPVLSRTFGTAGLWRLHAVSVSLVLFISIK